MSDHNAWRELLGPEEQQLLRTIEEQLFQPVAPASGWMGWGQKKLENLVSKVPESAQQALTMAVSGALETIQHGTDWLIAPEQVTNRICRRIGTVRYLSDSFLLPRTQIDALAKESISATLTGLTIEGGAAGLAGLVGLAADIPILYGALFRLIQEISMLYGFPTTGASEKLHMRTVLELGHHMNHPQRDQIVERLVHLQSRLRTEYRLPRGMFRTESSLGSRLSPPRDAGSSAHRQDPASRGETDQPSYQQSGQDSPPSQIPRPINDPNHSAGTSTAVTQQAMMRNLRLARELAMELLERKLFQGFMVVGSVIGASSNYKLAKDVGQAAIQIYQRRHLMELALRRCSELPAARITRPLR